MEEKTYEDYLQDIDKFLDGRKLVIEGKEVTPMSREVWGQNQGKTQETQNE